MKLKPYPKNKFIKIYLIRLLFLNSLIVTLKSMDTNMQDTSMLCEGSFFET